MQSIMMTFGRPFYPSINYQISHWKHCVARTYSIQAVHVLYEARGVVALGQREYDM